jgi:hypothetical protein
MIFSNDLFGIIVLWVGYVALKTIPLMTTLMALLIPTKFPLSLFFMPKREQICILMEKHLEVTSFRRNFAPGKKDYINSL